MRSYRDLFRTPEFAPLFVSASAQTVAQTMGGLALATLVHARTGSPLLSALSMFGPSLAHVLGATLLMSAADRLPPRVATTAVSLTYAAGTALLALPALPLPAAFAVLLLMGLTASVGGGVRWGLLNEILPKDAYLLGRSLFNMMSGLMQITGFAAGGLLLTALSPRLSLLLAAALHLTAAVTSAAGLTRRAPRVTGRVSVRATWQTNRTLFSSPARRRVYLALWIPNGLIVGCEALYVSYAPGSAGTLFACAAAGMLIGDVTVGRLLRPARMARLATPLLVLLAAPYLLFALTPPVPLAAALALLASTGFGAGLIHQHHLTTLTPATLTGHALGLHSSGMLTLQALAATLAGTLAQLTSPATAMTILALTSLTTTAALWRADHRARNPTSPRTPPTASSSGRERERGDECARGGQGGGQAGYV